MLRKYGKTAVVLVVFLGLINFLVLPAFSADAKIGSVDLRQAFYDYEKAKTLEKELNDVTEARQKTRTEMVEKVTKMRDEVELLSGEAKKKKEAEVEKELGKLQEFDTNARQEILAKRNDMFREVIDDIQKVVEDIGTKGNYDYILDSRGIMYSKKEFDITEKVMKELNKK